ncbi:MAG: sensor histidine kinase [Dehalococcoidia bacterium]
MVSQFTQLLARRYQGKLDPQADTFIGFAVDGARRMQNLIEDLLIFSRVNTQGKGSVLTDAESALGTANTNLRSAIEESGAVLTHDPLPVVAADPMQLTQLFQNLVGNAIKFRGEAPVHVHVAAVQQAGAWCFSVRDNGIGLDPQFAERVFVIFQRLHSRAAYPGTGIGLAICRGIVERHGGKIWVEAEPGAGATFSFTIPIQKGDQP